jgi:CDP-diglyceride synthetase
MIVEIHARLGNAAFFYAAILALWALWRIIRKQGVDSNFWGALVIAEGLILLQGILGVYLYFFSGLKLARQIHVLYGALSALVIPAAFGFTRGHQERRDMTIYTATMLCMALLAMRALQTAGMLLTFE